MMWTTKHVVDAAYHLAAAMIGSVHIETVIASQCTFNVIFIAVQEHERQHRLPSLIMIT
jgi:hypothetical protein